MVRHENEINDFTKQTIKTLRGMNIKDISKFFDLLYETHRNRGTVYIFGNGGSGAIASQIAGDFVKGVSFGLKNRFRCICLNDNMSTLMAVANDHTYESIFVEPLKNFLQKGDLVIGISGSGNSMNVVKAIEYANGLGVKTVALCGYDGGRIKKLAYHSIHADINHMEISEDIFLNVGHMAKLVLTKRLHLDEHKGTYISGKKKVKITLK